MQTPLPALVAATRHGSPVAVRVEVFDDHTNLATLDGTLWFYRGNRFTYSLTLCRRSSFAPPYVQVYVNGSARHTVHPDTWVYGAACDRWSAPVSAPCVHLTAVRNVQFVLAASSCTSTVYEEWRSTGGGPNHGPSYGRYDNPYR